MKRAFSIKLGYILIYWSIIGGSISLFYLGPSDIHNQSNLSTYPNSLIPNAINFDSVFDSNTSLISEFKPILDLDKVNFTSEELVVREFQSDLPTEGNLTIVVPENYAEANLAITLNILGAQNEEIIIEDNSTLNSPLEVQAQSFTIAKKSWVNQVNLDIAGNKDINPNITIVKNNLSGEVVFFRNSTLTEVGWVNILDSPILLDPDQYFVILAVPASEIAAQYVHWQKSTDNSTLTLSYDPDLDVWSSEAFDLGLILQISAYIPDISSLIVYINEIVMDYSDSLWKLNLTLPLANLPIPLNITSNISPSYTYHIIAEYTRQSEFSISYDFNVNSVNFNLTHQYNPISITYDQYSNTIGGIYSDFYNIELFFNATSVSYERVSINQIEIHDLIDEVLFTTNNIIDSLDYDPTLYVGNQTSINVSTSYAGFIDCRILSENETVYSNSSLTFGEISFQYNLDPPFPYQTLTIFVNFTGQNHFGWIFQPIEIIQRTKLSSLPIYAQVLDNINFECQYLDFYSNSTIENAILTYEFEGLSGNLVENENNAYTAPLNLSNYRFLPGNYELVYHASKNGYISQTKSIPVILGIRKVNLDISQNGRSLVEGEQLRIMVELTDFETQKSLLEPVDLRITIFSVDDVNTPVNESSYQILTQSASNIESTYEISLNIEKLFEYGNYSLQIEILSDIYEGKLVVPQILQINPPKSYGIYYLIIIPSLILSTSLFVANQKRITKKSLGGILILHQDGILIGEKIESNFTDKDPLLISGAISGMITLIQEITGSGMKTIEIDGGYLSLARGERYWMVLFLRKNPIWIQRTIKKCATHISSQFGGQIMNYNGAAIPISIDGLTLKFFGKIIEEDRFLNQDPNDNAFPEHSSEDSQENISNLFTNEANCLEGENCEEQPNHETQSDREGKKT